MKMFRPTILSLLLALTLVINAAAQVTDQVNLKNGSVIRGIIVKIVPDGDVTIDDQAGNTWVFAMSEVADIVQVENGRMQGLQVFEPGWVNMTSIGFLAGSQRSEYIAPFSIQNSLGYRMENGLYAGMVAGLEFLNINHIPLMADVQYSLNNGDVMPVMIARGGYAFPAKTSSDYYGTETTYSGGLSLAVGMGLKIRTRDDFAWDVDLLYRYMRISYGENYDYQTYDYSYLDVYNRVEIRVGFYLDMFRH